MYVGRYLFVMVLFFPVFDVLPSYIISFYNCPTRLLETNVDFGQIRFFEGRRKKERKKRERGNRVTVVDIFSFAEFKLKL